MTKDKIINGLIMGQKIMLLLAILCLPVFFMAKRYAFAGMGQKLSYYPILLGLILFALEYVISGRKKFQLNKLFIFYIIVCIGWSFIATIHGALIYPYANNIDFTDVRGYHIVSNLFQKFAPFFPQETVKIIYLTLRAFKLDAKDFLFHIFIAFWVYHLFLGKEENGWRFIRKSYCTLAVLLLVYAIPEFLVFDFHLKAGYDFLAVANSMLYDVGSYLNWYPPLIWSNSQVRSYATEPAFVGGLAVTIIPFLWSYFVSSKNLKYYFLFFCFMILLFASKARTSTLVGIFDTAASIVYSYFLRSKKYALIIIMISAVAFGTNIGLRNIPDSFRGDFNVYEEMQGHKLQSKAKSQPKAKEGPSSTKPPKTETASSYIADNVKTIASTTARSNRSRFTNIVGHLKVAAEHPAFGVGNTLVDIYVFNQLTKEDMKSGEIRNISGYVSKGDIFKYGYGNVNQYAYVLSTEGIIGLIIFLLPSFYILYKLVKLKLYRQFNILTLTVILAGNFVIMLAASAYTSYYIILGVLLLLISSAEKGKQL